jgi:glycosyltransferase involved in cell wall biosynthesis
MIHGGPNTQIRGTLRHMPQQGVQALFFDSWKPLRAGECDLVHLFGANIGTYHLARELRGEGIPTVVSPILFSTHSPTFVRVGLAGSRLLQKLGAGLWSDYVFQADICNWARKVLPNTRAEAGLVAKGLGVPQANLRVIPNGVDERFADADPSIFRNRYGLKDFILNVGHVGPGRKNTLRLIRALGGIDRPAVIIGRITKGHGGEECVHEASKRRNILLIDGLDHDSPLLASAYAACRVFVLPSLFETPGIAALEAALAGARVVITPYGGTKEYFEDMATYVDPESVESIRGAILAALDEKESRRLRDHVRSNFLWQEVARKTALAYREATGGTAA